MPRGKLLPEANPAAEVLRVRLTREWEHPSDEASQPIVIEAAGDRFNPTVHLYVIWDEWLSLSQLERSEIIMDAYEATHARQEILNVTVAMGLTVQEAERMGIRYEVENAA